MSTPWRLLVLAVLLLAAAGCARDARAWPDRPVLLICPWAAGGGTDRLSRQIAAFLEPELGVPVNVVNASGGAGVTGHSRGARARPDGHTLTMMTVEINMLHRRGLTRVQWSDFLPVMLLNRDPAAVFVRADDARVQDLDGLLEAIRVAPGAWTASGTATGGIWHLALAGALERAGIEAGAVRWIPMNGAAPALQELLGGGLDLVICGLPEARAMLASGRVRTLGVMAEARLPAYPDVPTLAEQGIDWSMGSWRGIGVPAGTPPEVVDRLAGALTRIVTGETVLAGQRFPNVLAAEGFNLTWQPPDATQAMVAQTEADLGALLSNPSFAALDDGPFGAMDFPRLLMVSLALVAFGLLFSGRGRRGGAPVTREASGPPVPARLVHVVEIVGAVALFALLADRLGFLPTSGLIVLYLMRRLGTGWRQSLLVSLVVVPAVYGLFAYLLRVPLPRGPLGW